MWWYRAANKLQKFWIEKWPSPYSFSDALRAESKAQLITFRQCGIQNRTLIIIPATERRAYVCVCVEILEWKLSLWRGNKWTSFFDCVHASMQASSSSQIDYNWNVSPVLLAKPLHHHPWSSTEKNELQQVFPWTNNNNKNKMM